MRLLAAVFVVLGVPSASADAVTKLDQAIACTEPFSPQAVLTALQHEGRIATKPFFVMDGVPSFPVVRPLQLHGLTVTFVSGWAPEGSLFFRAPGTPPSTFVSVAVAATPEAVAQKLGPANSQGGPPSRSIDDEIVAYGFRKHPGLTEITCDLSD
jgi:hypothetical protein